MSTINYIKSINAERNKKFIFAALFLLAVSAGTLLWHPDAKTDDKPEISVNE